jgi:hypothetical protein
MLPDPKQDITKWKIVDVLEEIVYCLLLQNWLHFRQAHGTPLTKINWMALMETAELILHGEFDSSDLSDLQALLLQHCQSQTPQVLSPYITKAEFIFKFISHARRGPNFKIPKQLVHRHQGRQVAPNCSLLDSTLLRNQSLLPSRYHYKSTTYVCLLAKIATQFPSGYRLIFQIG